METIKSFSIDHRGLEPGIYISRRDVFGKGLFTGTVTTLDLRFMRPNREPPIDQAALHTIEHLGAVFFRNHPDYGDNIIYFGPMGCRTGFYLVVWELHFTKNYTATQFVEGMCRYILDFEGDIPGATINQCGNYLEHNLEMAKYYTRRFLRDITKGPIILDRG